MTTPHYESSTANAPKPEGYVVNKSSDLSMWVVKFLRKHAPELLAVVANDYAKQPGIPIEPTMKDQTNG